MRKIATHRIAAGDLPERAAARVTDFLTESGVNGSQELTKDIKAVVSEYLKKLGIIGGEGV